MKTATRWIVTTMVMAIGIATEAQTRADAQLLDPRYAAVRDFVPVLRKQLNPTSRYPNAPAMWFRVYADTLRAMLPAWSAGWDDGVDAAAAWVNTHPCPATVPTIPRPAPPMPHVSCRSYRIGESVYTDCD